jgi:uncharacterized protein YndB with AHSA1/START domain
MNAFKWLYEKLFGERGVIVGSSAFSKKNPKAITITRMIDVNRQKVWDAWTKPEQLAQWWGVPPVAATPETTSIDLKVGGKWRADMVNKQDGSKLAFGGKYIEISPPNKIVFTIEDENNPKASKETVTLTFKDRIGTTEMVLHQEGSLPDEQYGDPLRNGYNAFFDRMLSMLRAGR